VTPLHAYGCFLQPPMQGPLELVAFHPNIRGEGMCEGLQELDALTSFSFSSGLPLDRSISVPALAPALTDSTVVTLNINAARAFLYYIIIFSQ